eukprot:5718822-Prymnesium_polylepis.3
MARGGPRRARQRVRVGGTRGLLRFVDMHGALRRPVCRAAPVVCVSRRPVLRPIGPLQRRRFRQRPPVLALHGVRPRPVVLARHGVPSHAPVPAGAHLAHIDAVVLHHVALRVGVGKRAHHPLVLVLRLDPITRAKEHRTVRERSPVCAEGRTPNARGLLERAGSLFAVAPVHHPLGVVMHTVVHGPPVVALLHLSLDRAAAALLTAPPAGS